MLVNAFHTSLEDREITFDGVGVNVSANVFALAVLYYAVFCKLLADSGVMSGFVSHQTGFARDISQNDRCNSLGAQMIDHDVFNLAGSAIHQRQDFVLVVITTAFLDAFRLNGDVVKLFDTPQLSGILHFQTLFFIIVRADITQRRM